MSPWIESLYRSHLLLRCGPSGSDTFDPIGVSVLELMRAVDAYCERIDASYWAEPINAVTNLAFVLAALVMWRRTKGMALARALCLVLGGIGIGSYLFHTHAQVWAAIADVTPILLFILLYLFAVNRDILHLKGWRAFGATALFYALLHGMYNGETLCVDISFATDANFVSAHEFANAELVAFALF